MEDSNFIKCRHCDTLRNISEQEYCYSCGGRESWQSKHPTQKNFLERSFGKIISWVDDSIIRVFFIFFIVAPLALYLCIEILGWLIGFKIVFF
ncbi:hypothetical protein KC929_03140 [Patescibacteria group bacterium]|nr:hypothetical protein [Patescibacteria group bacterium]